MFEDLQVNAIFNLEETIAKSLLEKCTFPWEALPKIESFIIELGHTLDKNKYNKVKENVWIHKDTIVYDTACINGPCIIMEQTEIRPSAFIRGKAIVGKKCVVGNSSELKNVILFNNVQVPHFNYLGDSIVGYKAHMGAGSITSNVKADKTLVSILVDDQRIETGLKKMGAMIGDHVEIGCNSVLNPGTVIGKRTNIYPLSMIRGYIPSDCIFKSVEGTVVTKK